MSEPMPPRNEFPATQAQLSAVERRLEEKLDKNTKTLALAIVKVDAKIDAVADSLRQEMRALSDRIFSFFDPLARKYESNNNAVTLHGHALVEAQVQLKDHERRLARLEGRAKA